MLFVLAFWMLFAQAFWFQNLQWAYAKKLVNLPASESADITDNFN
ncbi:MAG: hypothetical protein Q8K35_00500 [Thiobacillus sp.]|nr:hypothetical protein [Thiobacillus sp.]MDP2056224.1 hypothetical protein [Thiobacillus sp.]